MVHRKSLVLVLLGLISLSASPAAAVRYLSLGQAVKSFLPEGAKVLKVTKELTPQIRQRLWTDYGWKPEKDQYTFYLARDGAGQVQAYVVIIPEIFGTCFHKYAVGMRADGTVIDVAIVELSCPRATPINRKSFLKQFREKRHTDPLTIKSDVDAVTGATLSSETTARATRKAVSLHNLLLGKGEAVNVSAEVKAAREAGEARIDNALQSGELIDPKTGKGPGGK